jgi:hypothetical protein
LFFSGAGAGDENVCETICMRERRCGKSFVVYKMVQILYQGSLGNRLQGCAAPVPGETKGER